MRQIEFYWQDLTEKKQKEILEKLNMEPNDHNWDVFPIATLDVEVDEEG